MELSIYLFVDLINTKMKIYTDSLYYINYICIATHMLK